MTCLFCGCDAGAGSYGGPNVCAMCDCGYTVDKQTGEMRKWQPQDDQYKVLFRRRDRFDVTAGGTSMDTKY
jgi:hypothetical protein